MGGAAASGAIIQAVGGINYGVGTALQPDEEFRTLLRPAKGGEQRLQQEALAATRGTALRLGDLSALEGFLTQESLAGLGYTADVTGDFSTAREAQARYEDALARLDAIDQELKPLTRGRKGARTPAQQQQAKQIAQAYKAAVTADPAVQALDEQIRAVNAQAPVDKKGRRTLTPKQERQLADLRQQRRAAEQANPAYAQREAAFAALPPGGKLGQDVGMRKETKRQAQLLKNEQAQLRGLLPSLQDEMLRAADSAFQIQGVSREIDESTKAGRVNAIEAELEKRVLAAARGQAPADPVLEREIDTRRRLLEEQLRRDLGADYALTTRGSIALRDFERSSSEARAAAQRQVVMDFIPAAQQFAVRQAQQQNNLGGILNPGLTLFEASRQLAGDFSTLAEQRQRERIAAASLGEFYTPKSKYADIAVGIGQALAGVGAEISASGGRGQAAPQGGTTSANPSQLSVPTQNIPASAASPYAAGAYNAPAQSYLGYVRR